MVKDTPILADYAQVGQIQLPLEQSERLLNVAMREWSPL